MSIFSIETEVVRRYDQQIPVNYNYDPSSPMPASAISIEDFRSPILPTPSKPPKPTKIFRSDTLGLGLNNEVDTPSKPPKPIRVLSARDPMKNNLMMNDNIPKFTTTSSNMPDVKNSFVSPVLRNSDTAVKKGLIEPSFTSPLVQQSTNLPKGSSPDSLSDAEMDPDLSPFANLMRKRAESVVKSKLVNDCENNLETVDENAKPSNTIITLSSPRKSLVEDIIPSKISKPKQSIFSSTRPSIAEDVIPPKLSKNVSNTEVDIIPAKGRVQPDISNEDPSLTLKQDNPFFDIVRDSYGTRGRKVSVTDFDDDGMNYSAPDIESATKRPTTTAKKMLSYRAPIVEENDENDIPNTTETIASPLTLNFEKLNETDDSRRKSHAGQAKKGFLAFQDIGQKAKKRFASISVPGRRTTFFKPTPQQQKASLLKHIIAGEAEFVKELLNSGCPKIDKKEASSLLLKCVDDIDALQQPLETITILLDDLGADVNAADKTGRTSLAAQFNNSMIGQLLMSRGANPMAEDEAGSCALSITFEYGIEWMFDLWISMGSEDKLLKSKDKLLINKYVACLILGGYGVRAGKLIQSKDASINADEATQLFAMCQGNFENMKEPVETFELLESLGAKIEFQN